MKRLLFLMLSATTLLAMPAKRTPTVVSQPDGSTLTVVAFGDERYHFNETLDGYVVVKGADRFWYFAALNAEGRFEPTSVRVRGGSPSASDAAVPGIAKHLREARSVVHEQLLARPMIVRGNVEHRQMSGMPKASSTNATVKHVLVLCVKYPDMPSTETAVSYQSMINDDNWHSGVGGMSKYYEEVSYNALSIEADYQEWITAAHNFLYYADSDPNGSAHTQELVAQCLDSAEARGVDFSTYDNDGDGEVDGVFMIHAGPGAEEGNTDYIWSHAGGLGASSARTYDGVSIASFITMPELYDGGHVDIGVFSHEYGHMLGLPDTYDVDYATNGESSGLGAYCLMAGGSWGGNGDPERPVQMSAYCKALLGFVTPTEVAANGTISVPQVETNPVVYKIWLDENRSDEYVLIENRQKTGFDLNLRGSGLLMYHIDRNLADIWPASNSINVTNTHLGIKLYEADGDEDLANGTNNGDSGDPYPGASSNTALAGSSTPNSDLWSGTPSGVEITGISASAATMTADVVVPTYYGSSQQFFRQTTGSGYGNASTNTAYGMVKVVPTESGKILGVRVFSFRNRHSNITAQVFSTLSGSTLSGAISAAVSGASDVVDKFIALDFSPGVDVTAGVPVYVRIRYDRTSGGYVVPIDLNGPITGLSYYSSNGTSFTNLTSYDVLARVVLKNNNPLPVQLASFHASPGIDGVTLRWETASEIGNFGFQLERDTVRVAHVFTAVAGAFVPGHGTTLQPHTYSVVDGTARAGRWVYRLKQIDLDGTVHLSEHVEVDITTTDLQGEASLPMAFSLEQNFPNPFNPTTQITFSLPVNAEVRLAVYDVLGREVAVLATGTMNAGTYAVPFQASHLSSGAYFYALKAGTFTSLKRMLLVR